MYLLFAIEDLHMHGMVYIYCILIRLIWQITPNY